MSEDAAIAKNKMKRLLERIAGARQDRLDAGKEEAKLKRKLEEFQREFAGVLDEEEDDGEAILEQTSAAAAPRSKPAKSGKRKVKSEPVVVEESEEEEEEEEEEEAEETDGSQAEEVSEWEEHAELPPINNKPKSKPTEFQVSNAKPPAPKTLGIKKRVV